MDFTKNERRQPSCKLFWQNPETGENQPAGDAYYVEDYGDFRLKIDCFPESKFYLNPVKSEDGETSYRVVVIINRHSRFSTKKVVGSGVLNDDKIIMELAPFSKALVLDLN